MIAINRYLESKSDNWLASELEQAMATAQDATKAFEERDQAFSAAYFLARELERRRDENA